MSGEGFLARWSRRKREAEAEPAESVPAEPETHQPPACPVPDLPEIDLASLPRIEDLTAESDFTLFLRPGIPGALRNAALRRMWSLDSSIRDFIGPVDYQWDFNTPGGLPLGFANDLAGDIGKLLMQAIGKLDEPAEAPRVELPEPQPSPLLPSPEPEAAPIESPETLAEPAEAPRRRHGGALPA